MGEVIGQTLRKRQLVKLHGYQVDCRLTFPTKEYQLLLSEKNFEQLQKQ